MSAEVAEGAFIFLGIGNTSLLTNRKLHTPQFKMDDSMMPVGAALHVGVAMQYIRDRQPQGSNMHTGDQYKAYEL